MVRLNCKCCGQFHWVIPSKKNKKFCSKSCYALHKKSKRPKVSCIYCENIIHRSPAKLNTDSKNYCDFKCMGKHRDKHLELKCDYCDNTFLKSKAHYENSNHHFCNKEHYNKWRTKYPNTLHLRNQVNNRRDRRNLADWYVSTIIKETTSLTSNDITNEMIQVKRVQLLAHRQAQQ